MMRIGRGGWIPIVPVVIHAVTAIVLPSSAGASCGEPATAVHVVQGIGDSSPLVGQPVTVEGVVVADLQADDSFGGFFLQEEAADQDGDPMTSEGVWVFHGTPAPLDLSVGDRVRVVGQVQEFNGLTQVNASSGTISPCGTAPLPEVTPLVLPLPTGPGDVERLEGMRIEIVQTLHVTDTYQLGEFGSVALVAGPEPFLYAPTERALPGSADYLALADLNRRRLVLVDDGRNVQYLDPVPYVGWFTPETLRRGDRTTAPVTGVVDERFGSYRVHPTAAPAFERIVPRPPAPDPGGDLRVTVLNALNYFATIDDGANGARGADSPAELSRQRTKLVSAICGLDADVVGLVEIENDGDAGAASAIADLAAAVDAGCGPGWTWITTGTTGDNPGGAAGPDAITNALLYDETTVAPQGTTAVLETGTFDGVGRPPVAQSFLHLDSGESLTVVVNHFRAKSCSGAAGPDLDQGDGQGCFNHTRTVSSQELAAWLATDPTATGDSHILVVGDLNAYSFEDPVQELVQAGFVNLTALHVPEEERYSFVFFGEAGLLDHALASSSLASLVTGVAIWHVNADEPRTLDYDDDVVDTSTFGDVLNRDTSVWGADPFRSSDHDPLIIGLALSGGAIFADSFESGGTSGWSAAVP